MVRATCSCTSAASPRVRSMPRPMSARSDSSWLRVPTRVASCRSAAPKRPASSSTPASCRSMVLTRSPSVLSRCSWPIERSACCTSCSRLARWVSRRLTSCASWASSSAEAPPRRVLRKVDMGLESSGIGRHGRPAGGCRRGPTEYGEGRVDTGGLDHRRALAFCERADAAARNPARDGNAGRHKRLRRRTGPARASVARPPRQSRRARCDG